MSAIGFPDADQDPASSGSAMAGSWRGRLVAAENIILCLALAAMIGIPLAEALLRKTFGIGISGAASLVQHLCLVVGMLGGAIAARDNRLLALSALETFLKGGWKSTVKILRSSVAVAVGVFLLAASVQFMLAEKEGGSFLAYHIPRWAIIAIIPAGFGIISLRVLRLAANHWPGRILTAALAGVLLWLVLRPPLSAEAMVTPLLTILFVATILGAPIFVTIGGAALILFWGKGEPISSLTISHYDLVTNPSLPTVPLFILAGYFLAEGGASKRLIRVFQALVGQFRGGPAIMTALVCAFFTSFTGGSGVTILALGGLLMPVLLAARYSEKDALGLLTGAGSLGLLFPPCLPLILYAIVARIPIEQMFLGGIIPGIIMVVMTAMWGIWKGPKDSTVRPRFQRMEAQQALWAAKWELLLPVVAFVGLFSGLATPVEAAAATALYALLVETIVYRDLRIFRDSPRVMAEAGLLVGGVFLILGVALGFTNYLVDAEIPKHTVEWVTRSIHSPILFLLLLNLVLLVAGSVMEIYAAIVVLVPLLVKGEPSLIQAFGLDPVHFGIIFLTNMELGFLVPPIGINLLLASYRFKKPLLQVSWAALPMLLVLFIGLMLITYIPILTTWLPHLFAKTGIAP